jgi:iron(III) transport system substrate-binding protein
MVAALALGACGGSDGGDAETGFEDVFAAVEGLEAEPRMTKLAELAKEEGGQLSFYTAMTTADADAVASAFEDAYDVAVAVYRATGEAIALRLLEEHEAEFRGADVVDATGVTMLGLGRDGILVPYDAANRAGLIEGAARDGWTASRATNFVVSWNTKRVPVGERPRSWEDLADPRWRGRLALEAGDHDWFMTLWQYWLDQGKSEQEVERLFKAIADGALVVNGHPLMSQLTVTGEVDVAASAHAHTVDDIRAEGAPIAWRPPVEPIIVALAGVGLVHGAQHPATAALFVEWLLSDEGQKVIADAGRTPTRRDLSAGATVEQLLIDLKRLNEEDAEWAERYETLLRSSKQHGG